ncbi:MAG: hypothetical protein AB1705_22305 [Verrucomicrobiota bacterium]
MTNTLASLTLAYTNLAAHLLTGSVTEFADAAGIAAQPPDPIAFTQIDGRRRHPFGSIERSDYRFKFDDGQLISAEAIDLFRDRGSETGIIPHLLNTRLQLTPGAAKAQARRLLKSLGYDVEKLAATHHIVTEENRLFVRIQDPGPNFPKDLIFSGQCGSRKTIDLRVKFISKGSVDTRTHIQMSFLATDGRLRGFWVEPSFQVTKLGVLPPPLTIEHASDFALPVLTEASATVAAPNLHEPEIASAVESAWKLLTERLGTNRAGCILVCDNLGNPAIVRDLLNRKAAGIPWAGIFHPWSEEPFKAQRSIRKPDDFSRGIHLLAVSGNVELKLDIVKGLSVRPPGPEDKLDATKWHKAETARVREIALLFAESRELDPNRDHLFVLLTGDDSAISFQIECGKIWKNQAGFVKSGKPFRTRHPLAGAGVYHAGKTVANAVAIAQISGRLPRMKSFKAGVPGPIADIPEGLSALADRFRASPADAIRANMGSPVVDMILHPDRVEAFRLPTVEERRESYSQTLDGYGVLKRTLVKNSRDVLQGSLLDDRHQYGLGKACLFDPPVAFRFSKNGESATALVCFGCDDIVLLHRDAKGKELSSLRFEFKSVVPELLTVSRRLFPNDALLRNLRE